MELERSVDVDSYGVSGSDGGSDDLCAVPAVRRRSVYLHQRAASGGVRLWCRMVLGFMATIYVSGERVYAPLYGILLAVTLFGICRQRSVWKEPAAVSSAVFLTALTVVCCAVNVLFIVLSL